MNKFVRFTFTVVFVVILTACAAPAQPSPTLVPTQTAPPPTPNPATATPQTTPTPLHPANTQLATDKLAAGSNVMGPVLFTLPGMDQVSIANVPYNKGLTMDIYYPPSFDFSSPVPAVIFVGGIGDPILKSAATIGSALKDIDVDISWGQLVAASGLIGINYETDGNPTADTRALVKFTLANAPWLGVDKDHLCLWSASSNTPAALGLLAFKDGEYQPSLSCAVMYYADTTVHTKYLPSGLPLLVVKAGRDDPSTNAGLDEFVTAAEAAGLPVEYIEYKEGIHGFDAKQDTDETRAIVARTLEFMKENLSSP